MDIKVGEYVRTNEGFIRKVDQIGEITIWLEDNTSIGLDERNIKHSFDIIDLIEVGDILEILCNEITQETLTVRIVDIEQLNVLKQIPRFIKTIVTKEQFKAMEYEV